MADVEVTGPSPYTIHISHRITDQVAPRAKEIGARKVAIVHQAALKAVARGIAGDLEAVGVQPVMAEIPDAEAGKSLDTASTLWDLLGTSGFSRQDAVIGLGGGAATDIAGFVAATWMRGIKVIQVPTTLLAMVDAAVGGKTGMNTEVGKNLVGAFHEPDSVFIDLERIFTLPEEEIVSGSAELVKTGFIADPKILDLYRDGSVRGEWNWEELVRRSVAVKAAVVSRDLTESGLREILNYGHTLGHAIERREQYTWRHGNAVGVGMMFAAHLAHERGLIDATLLDLHREILTLVGLPTSYEPGAFDELYEAMTHDKKNRDGRIRFVVLNALGSCTRLEDATVEEMRAAYDAISQPTQEA
ncbi:3-dehydroquinate synthase [Corynebacterium hadale]|uniref:3-dehydroquinate synthase n=1 Tax=Corynebacterium hadale TaxID=2026255 RepID=UPI001EF265D4|nr:3-dehydroquinate synthase [Corynebacterium hadale]MCG7253242.1 3-dehydroquinate synthase [Corynebacterium hadale]MCG7255539.1 3-dehydroquinate synthase [Corynebacterium hadale]MCG7264370.1 3-dehydroquinate synthase [Corynebacterium hadale]